MKKFISKEHVDDLVVKLKESSEKLFKDLTYDCSEISHNMVKLDMIDVNARIAQLQSLLGEVSKLHDNAPLPAKYGQ